VNCEAVLLKVRVHSLQESIHHITGLNQNRTLALSLLVVDNPFKIQIINHTLPA
jgi:hypothetical protein